MFQVVSTFIISKKTSDVVKEDAKKEICAV